MVLAFDGFMGHGIYKQLELQHFLVTTGTITHSELSVSHGSKGSTSYSAKLEYQYDVSGQMFTGDKIRFWQYSFSQATRAPELGERSSGRVRGAGLLQSR